MATTNHNSGLSAEHEKLLDKTAALQAQSPDNNTFPAVNSPPKTGHTRTASGTTDVSGTLKPASQYRRPWGFFRRVVYCARLPRHHARPAPHHIRRAQLSSDPHFSVDTHLLEHWCTTRSGRSWPSFRSNQASNVTKGVHTRSSKVAPSDGTATLVLSKLSFWVVRRKNDTLNSALQAALRREDPTILLVRYQIHRGLRLCRIMLS
jgi:hypothetical protein